MKSSKKFEKAVKEYREALEAKAISANPYTERDEELAFEALAIFRAGKEFERIGKSASNRKDFLEKLRPAPSSCLVLNSKEFCGDLERGLRLASLTSTKTPKELMRAMIKVLLESDSRWTGNPFFRKQSWSKTLILSKSLDKGRLWDALFEQLCSFDDRRDREAVNNYGRTAKWIIELLEGELKKAEDKETESVEKSTPSSGGER